QLYDVSEGTLARWGVLINHRLKMLICLACHAVILPSTLAQHVARQHGDARISIDGDRLTAITESEGILNELPMIEGTPVEYTGLKTEEGAGCPFCLSVYGSAHSVAKHVRLEHGQSLSEKDSSIRRVHIQRFGRGVFSKAPFEVKLRALQLQSSEADYIEAMRKDLDARPSLPSSEIDHRHI
ncbi:hypothetical protein OH77DRAFT_1370144, partial [Trametes cingulata]